MDSSNIPGIDDAEEAARLLTFIDTQEIYEMDPSRSQGHHIPTEADLNMLISLKPNQSIGPNSESIRPVLEGLNSTEKIHMKVLVMGEENDPGGVRFELTSEEDIFFHYVCK